MFESLSFAFAVILGAGYVVAAFAYNFAKFMEYKGGYFSLDFVLYMVTDPWVWVFGIGMMVIATVGIVIGVAGMVTGIIDDLLQPDDTGTSNQNQQLFRYQQQSKVELVIDPQAEESFYRVLGYNEADKTVHLTLAHCPNKQTHYDTKKVGYDFSDCEAGSYYLLPTDNSDEQADAKQKALKAQSKADHWAGMAAQRLSGLSDDMRSTQSRVAEHNHHFNDHRNKESQHRSSLRPCSFWDLICHWDNGVYQTRIAHHAFWKDHHYRQMTTAQSELIALRAEHTELESNQQALNAKRVELNNAVKQLNEIQKSSRMNHDDGTVSIATSEISTRVHWVDKYTAHVTFPSNERGEFEVIVDCPLDPQICQKMRVNSHYPVLFQWGIEETVGTLEAGFVYDDSRTPRWKWQVSEWPFVDWSSHGLESPDGNPVNEHSAFTFSLALHYDEKGADGPGSSATESQIIQEGDFNYFKYFGALKGRWHTGDIEVDGQEIVRWQRLEHGSAEQDANKLILIENHNIIMPGHSDDELEPPGIGYHTADGIKRLIEPLPVNLNKDSLEDSLEDLLLVYSNNSGTKITYREPNGEDDPLSDADEPFLDAIVLADLDVTNIDRVQLIQSTHYVPGQQDGVHYLLLHSMADRKLYPVVLVQPKESDLNDSDQAPISVVSAEAIPDALAVDGLWLSDPAHGFAEGDKLLVSWIVSKDEGIYIDRTKLEIHQQTYELTSPESLDAETSYSLAPVSGGEGTESTHILNTYGLNTDLPNCEPSTTYSYRGHLSLQLINDPQTVDNQLGAVVSASNACELVRTMDPYHRGKTDLLLVQNRQQSLNAWGHLSLSHLPQDRFAFYMDYSDGGYQVQDVIVQENSNAAAHQYPLSASLQSQHLGTNEPDEQDSFIATFNHYCEKEQLEDQRCIAEWFKAATHNNDEDSIFDACSTYGEVDSAFVGCLRQKTMARLNSFLGNDISSMVTRLHKFTHSYDDGHHFIHRQDLNSGKIATIDVEGLFSMMEYILSSYEAGAEQASNYEHQRPLLSELAHGIINGLIPKSYAGTEIGACLDKGHRSTQVCALMDYAKIMAVTIIAADKISINNPTDSQSAEANNLVNAETVLALNLPVTSGHVKRDYFCFEEQSITQCDSHAQGANKITITQKEESLSVLVTLNGLGPDYFQISQNQPGYSTVQDWYQGGSTQIEAALAVIIVNLYVHRSSAAGEVSEPLKELVKFIIRRLFSGLASQNTFPVDDDLSITLMALMTGIGLDQLSSDNPSTKKYSQQVAIYIWVMEWLVMQDLEHDQDIAHIVDLFSPLDALTCDGLCEKSEQELLDLGNQIGELQEASENWLGGKIGGLTDFLEFLQNQVNLQQTLNHQAFNQSLKQHETAPGRTVANELETLRTKLSEDVIKSWQLLYPLGGVDKNGKPHLKSFQSINLEYIHDVKTLWLHFNDVNNGTIYKMQITEEDEEDMVEVWINDFRLSDAWAILSDTAANGSGELNHAIDKLRLTTAQKVITYVGRFIPQITALIQAQNQRNASDDQIKQALLNMEQSLVSPDIEQPLVSSVTILHQMDNPQPQDQIELVENRQVRPNGGEVCTICTNNVDPNSCFRCQRGHPFHYNCLAEWINTQLRQNRPASCPNCNAVLDRIQQRHINNGANPRLRLNLLRLRLYELYLRNRNWAYVVPVFVAFAAKKLWSNGNHIQLIFKLHVPRSAQIPQGETDYLDVMPSKMDPYIINGGKPWVIVKYFCNKEGTEPPKMCMNQIDDADGMNDDHGVAIYAHVELSGEEIHNKFVNNDNQVLLNFQLLNVIRFDDTDLSSNPKAVISDSYEDLTNPFVQSGVQEQRLRMPTTLHLKWVKLNRLIPHYERDSSVQSLSYNHDSTINMAGMFSSASLFNSPIGNWNVSKVIDMSYMFANARNFNQDIGEWDTSKVMDMTHMFSFATKFNRNISGWRTSRVTDMSYLFFKAEEFNQDISEWDTSIVKSMKAMFADAKNFNQDISKWNTSQVINMDIMFNPAPSFNQDISGWNVQSVNSHFKFADQLNKDYWPKFLH